MNRTERLERFNQVVSVLRSEKNKSHVNQLVRFDNLLNELKDLKTKVYPKRRAEAQLAFEHNKSALQLSSFELMEYNFRENSHSNVLGYLFDYTLIGDKAIEILCNVIKLFEENNTSIINNIEQKKYTVTREKTTQENKRIDLFIEDNANEFVIVIENKILSEVTQRVSLMENAELISRDQLDDYTRFINTRYPSYTSLFILLQLRNDEKDYEPFKKINYKQLEEILINIHDLKDDIFIDYKRLLKSLNKNIDRKKKIILLQKANALNSKKEIKLILTEIEQIKTLSYEY
jgi:hypothetical protein